MAQETITGYLPEDIRSISIAESEGLGGTSSSEYIHIFTVFEAAQKISMVGHSPEQPKKTDQPQASQPDTKAKAPAPRIEPYIACPHD